MDQYTYEIVEDRLGQSILRRSDSTYIPMLEENPLYQAYLNRDNPDWGKPFASQEETAK